MGKEEEEHDVKGEDMSGISAWTEEEEDEEEEEEGGREGGRE